MSVFRDKRLLPVPIFLATYILNKKYGFGLHQTQGPSMLPTINNDIVIVNKFSYRLLGERPKKGDVVAALAPSQSDSTQMKVVCKRVAAIEGDSVSYISKGQMEKKVVPPNHVWLLGDNPNLSVDSRTYGPLPVENVTCKVVMTIYPNIKMIK